MVKGTQTWTLQKSNSFKFYFHSTLVPEPWKNIELVPRNPEIAPRNPDCEFDVISVHNNTWFQLHLFYRSMSRLGWSFWTSRARTDFATLMQCLAMSKLWSISLLIQLRDFAWDFLTWICSVPGCSFGRSCAANVARRLNQRPDSEIKRVKTSRNQISTKHHTFHKISQTYKHIIILHFFLRWKRFRSVSGFGDLTRTLTKMTATAFARLVTDLGPEKMRNKQSQHQTSLTKPPFNRGIGLITNHPQNHFTKCSLYQCSLMFMPELTSERHICLWKTWPDALAMRCWGWNSQRHSRADSMWDRCRWVTSCFIGPLDMFQWFSQWPWLSLLRLCFAVVLDT